MLIINTLAPIFLIVFLGSFLQHRKFLPSNFFTFSNKLLYWIALPCLLFYKTSKPVGDISQALGIFAVLVIGMLVCIFLGYIVAWIMGLKKQTKSAFVQGAYRGNLVYVGLPVVLYTISGIGGNINPEIETLAILAIAPLIPIYNIVAVIILIIGQEHGNNSWQKNIKDVLIEVLKNPLLIACVAGIGYSYTGLNLPILLERTCSTIAQMTLPLALLGVGASLTFESIQDGILRGGLAAILKTGFAPFIGFLVGSAIGLSPLDLRIAMLYLAAPTAVVSFIMAERLGADSRLASEIIVLSTLFSIPGFTTVILIT